MRDEVYRVVLSHFKEARVSRENINLLLESVKQIEKRTIHSKEELLDVLKEQGMDKRTFQDTVSEIMENGEGKDIISVAKGLGEKNGLGILLNSWMARNVTDEKVLKSIRPADWDLFRDKDWMETNKITKD